MKDDPIKQELASVVRVLGELVGVMAPDLDEEVSIEQMARRLRTSPNTIKSLITRFEAEAREVGLLMPVTQSDRRAKICLRTWRQFRQLCSQRYAHGRSRAN